MSLNSPEYLALAAEIAQAEGDLAKLTLKLDEISADAALMAGGFLPPPAGTAADLVSLGKDLAAGDWGSAFWDAVGIIPIVGDGAKAAAKGGKIANKLTDVKKAIEKANQVIQKKKDDLAKLCKDKQVKNKEKVTDKAENCGKGDCSKKPQSPKRMDRHEVPCFKKGKSNKATNAEYDRQLADQEKALNEMSVGDYQKARDLYKQNNRHPNAAAEQQKSRTKFQAEQEQKIRKSKVEAGMKPAQAEAEATKEAADMMKGLDALHTPDLIAGGYNNPTPTDMGDRSANRSIGGQWPQNDRVDGMDREAEKAAQSHGKDAKMNVKLKRCGK